MRAVGALLALGLLVGIPSRASAHPLAPGLLELAEQADGRVAVRFELPLQASLVRTLAPEWPPGCTLESGPRVETEETRARLRATLRCPGGLVGRRVGVAGLERSGTNVLLRAELADGRVETQLLRAGAPALTIPSRPLRLVVLRDFLVLGAGHFAGGLDHVLFVSGLVLLVGGTRRLLLAVTAFTAGHAATLTLATLGGISLPPAAVELGIAASLVAVGVEAWRGTVAGEPGRGARGIGPRGGWRWPAAAAAGFGLLHGLGFAGALRETGLPAGEVPLALLAFNLGIEAAQLLWVGLLLLALAVARCGPAPRWLSEAVVACGVWLVLERAVAFAG